MPLNVALGSYTCTVSFLEPEPGRSSPSAAFVVLFLSQKRRKSFHSIHMDGPEGIMQSEISQTEERQIPIVSLVGGI